MFDQTEQSFCGLSAALAEGGKTTEVFCFVLSPLSAVALSNAGSGYDIKVGDGEDDSDCCVGRPVGQVV